MFIQVKATKLTSIVINTDHIISCHEIIRDGKDGSYIVWYIETTGKSDIFVPDDEFRKVMLDMQLKNGK